MSQAKKLLIASDHAGYGLKQALQHQLKELDWTDLGPADDRRVDYPDFAEKLARKVAAGEADGGVLVCGSGIGMCIAANKVDGVRAAVVENPIAARLAREHNNANVLCLGSRFVAPEYADAIIRTWLDAEFDSESRHAGRVRKINEIEKKERK